MGIDYSVTAGYGLAVNEQYALRATNVEDVNDIINWLVDNEYFNIDVNHGGNAWSGDTYVLFFAVSTGINIDIGGEDGLFMINEPHDVAIEDLDRLASQLNLNERPGYIVTGNVF